MIINSNKHENLDSILEKIKFSIDFSTLLYGKKPK